MRHLVIRQRKADRIAALNAFASFGTLEHPCPCSGGRPPTGVSPLGRTGSSPRLRGTSCGLPVALRDVRFVPAPAGEHGMMLINGDYRTGAGSSPAPAGNMEVSMWGVNASDGLSPRLQRTWHLAGIPKVKDVGFHPRACEGTCPRWYPKSERCRFIPRLRACP
ncbi:MAG: hypothetical protein R3B95_02900 [Nitrospirales bacterium]|nr:hypothetical protein [Nitrospirales bacterium]